jgi:hypothetical protein
MVSLHGLILALVNCVILFCQVAYLSCENVKKINMSVSNHPDAVGTQVIRVWIRLKMRVWFKNRVSCKYFDTVK